MVKDSMISPYDYEEGNDLIILIHTTGSNSHFNSTGTVHKKHTYRKRKDKTVTT